jgi:hypothetical protein
MLYTIGASPKKIAATITSLIVPYIVGLLLNLLGAEIDVDTVTAIVGPVVLAIVVYITAHVAPPGHVVPKDEVPPQSSV